MWLAADGSSSLHGNLGDLCHDTARTGKRRFHVCVARENTGRSRARMPWIKWDFITPSAAEAAEARALVEQQA